RAHTRGPRCPAQPLMGSASQFPVAAAPAIWDGPEPVTPASDTATPDERDAASATVPSGPSPSDSTFRSSAWAFGEGSRRSGSAKPTVAREKTKMNGAAIAAERAIVLMVNLLLPA